MQKFISALMILAAAVSGSAAAANSGSRENPSPQAIYGPTKTPDYAAADPGFAIVDIVLLRPLSFAVTTVGAALFIATSPLTAMASIPEPHNAFAMSYKVLIEMPARYTFVRPVGDKTLLGYDTQYGKYLPSAFNNLVNNAPHRHKEP